MNQLIPSSSATQTTKCCRHCRRDFPATPENFHRSPQSKDGLREICKKCANEYGKAYHQRQLQANPEKLREIAHRSYLKRRAATDPLIWAERLHKSYLKRARKTYEYMREYRARKPEVQRQSNRRRTTRLKELPHAFSEKDWEYCLAYWRRRCAYCETVESDERYIGPDHFIPITSSDCPGTIPANIVPCCSSCNASKQDKLPADWLIQRFGSEPGQAIYDAIQTFFKCINGHATTQTTVCEEAVQQ